MIYFISLFFILYATERNRTVFHSLFITLSFFPGIFYLLSVMGGKVTYNPVLDILYIGTFIILLLYLGFTKVKNTLSDTKISTVIVKLILLLMIPAASFCYFLFICKDSLILPVHDPITVPSLAKVIFHAGRLPHDPRLDHATLASNSLCELLGTFFDSRA